MAPRVRKKLSPFSARGTPRDRDPRAEAMARQGTTRFKRENIDTDQKRGFFGDLAQMGRDLSGYDQVKDSGFVKDLSQMGRDLIVDPVKKYSPGLPGGIQRGLGSLTNNLAQNEENERILGDAYSDDVRKEMMSPSDRAFYEKYMRIGDSKSGQEADYYYDEARKALENAQITRRVNYALGDQPFGFDTSAEAGTHNVDYGGLSERLQSGLQGTKGGREFLSDVIPKGEALRDTGMIGNAAANIARAQAEGRAGFATPEMRQAAVLGAALPEAVSIETIPEEGWDEQFLFPPRSALSMQGQNFGRGEAHMSPEESQLLMDLYTDPFHGDQYYRQGHIPTIDEIAGTGYTDYKGVNPFREPYVPMEGPSPVPLPPYLSADTDWFTPEPEAKGLIPRGLEELIIDQYGVDAPGVERERRGPNTPPPGYESPPAWYQKYLDQFGFNTGYDYYNE